MDLRYKVSSLLQYPYHFDCSRKQMPYNYHRYKLHPSKNHIDIHSATQDHLHSGFHYSLQLHRNSNLSFLFPAMFRYKDILFHQIHDRSEENTHLLAHRHWTIVSLMWSHARLRFSPCHHHLCWS